MAATCDGRCRPLPHQHCNLQGWRIRRVPERSQNNQSTIMNNNELRIDILSQKFHLCQPFCFPKILRVEPLGPGRIRKGLRAKVHVQVLRLKPKKTTLNGDQHLHSPVGQPSTWQCKFPKIGYRIYIYIFIGLDFLPMLK